MSNAGSFENHVYLGTVLLEKNRWLKGERVPSLAVSDWTRKIADAGFDGLELWQNHALLAGEQERENLRRSPVTVRIFNSYARCETEALTERTQTAELVRYFQAAGMKFNFGREMDRHAEYLENVKLWRTQLPQDFRFLCECHGGTTVEEPLLAAEAFRNMNRDSYEIIIHGFGGEDAEITRLFEIHSDRITHVHTHLSPKGPPDESLVQKRVNLLHSLGFRGSFTIEFTQGVGTPDEPPETLFRNAARDLALLRKCLKRG